MEPKSPPPRPEPFPYGWAALAAGAFVVLAVALFREAPEDAHRPSHTRVARRETPSPLPPEAPVDDPLGASARRSHTASTDPMETARDAEVEPEPPGARAAIPWPLWVRGGDAAGATTDTTDAATDGGDARLEQARTYFRQGAEAYEARSFTLAAGYFERAWREVPDPISLVLAADARIQSGERDAAGAHLRTVLARAAPTSLAAWRARRLALSAGMPELLTPSRDAGGG